MKPSHHDYDKQEESMSHRGLLDALGDTTHERGGGGGRKGSVFDKIQFGHGQEERSKQNQNNSQGYHEGGGVMHALKEKVAVGKIESHRDSTDSTSADVGRLPGNLYASIRGDVSK
jgi:hypothetical protein